MNALTLAPKPYAAVRPSDVAPQTAMSGMLAMGGLGGSCALWLIGLIAAMPVGRDALAAVLASGALVIAWCFVGHVSDSQAMRHLNGVGLVIVVGSLVVRAIGVGALIGWFWSRPQLREAFDPVWLAIGFVASLVGWQAGFIWVHRRMRQPIFDQEYVPVIEGASDVD